jgi:uncharacterized protein with HEPN domain
MPRDEAVLLDIARAARLVLEFKEGLGKAAFLQDLKTQSAVLHQLMVMGEAVKRLSPDFRAEHSEIPWPLIAGMRDNHSTAMISSIWMRCGEQRRPTFLSCSA